MTTLEVGRIVKPHGLRGEVIVELFTNRTERVAPGTSLSTERGPLVVERSSPHQGRWIVRFEGVGDVDTAESLRGVVLSAEPLEDPDALWVHELVGAEVVGVDGAAHGRVVAVEANPASDLLVLEGGGLVPLRFVVSHGEGRVVVDPPVGLLDADQG
ncbi:MAG TPA: ribosome maturation factor RimM [Acidimicrobiales bacterium]|nr:ribosome maturation factor RimM [Acidimicrobiales bacterium]